MKGATTGKRLGNPLFWFHFFLNFNGKNEAIEPNGHSLHGLQSEENSDEDVKRILYFEDCCSQVEARSFTGQIDIRMWRVEPRSHLTY
jgi:hypothetical protein